MKEIFNFSKLEDQKKFEALPKEEKDKYIEEAHKEAIGINDKKENKESRESFELEKKEFINGLLLSASNSFRNELCNVFSCDSRHAPAFLADLVFSLDSVGLQRLKETFADYNFDKSLYILNEFLEELEAALQKGENKTETWFNSLSLKDYENEDIKTGRSKKEEFIFKVDLKENLEMFTELIRFFTNKELNDPDFISEKTIAPSLKDNPNLREYIEYIREFIDDFMKEKALKYKDILGNIDDFKVDSLYELVNSYYDCYEQQQIKKINLEKLEQFTKTDPLKDKRVFEIGGTALAKTLKDAGADAVSFDASGFDWSAWGKTVESTKVSNTMNSGNYQDILSKIDSNQEHVFDITTSRMVFDDGSGIESTVPSGDYDEAAEEILKVLSKITKKGGYSIHQLGFTDGLIFKRDEEEKLKKLNFKKKFVLQNKNIEEKSAHPLFVKKLAADMTKEEYYNARILLREGGSDFNYPVVVLEKI